jgi:hypothetical protein
MRQGDIGTTTSCAFPSRNKAIFDKLAESKQAIEASFGERLEWQRLEGRRSCRIKEDIDLGRYRGEEKRPQVHDATIDAMIRLEKALKSHVARLDVSDKGGPSTRGSTPGCMSCMG